MSLSIFIKLIDYRISDFPNKVSNATTESTQCDIKTGRDRDILVYSKTFFQFFLRFRLEK